MNKRELLKHIGSIEQIGGIKDFTFNEGKAKGVRALEINTGKICFTVLPDRCMDIAQTFYEGKAVSWISKTGITSPHFYEKDGQNFLRSFYGGLVTTCGLENIGAPYKEHGLHGRIGNIPAQKVSVFADWVGDDYIMKVSGEVRENSVTGPNLVLKRTITTKLFDESLMLEDTVINEGFEDRKITLCYHCNFGYPLVKEGAKIINVPESASLICAPIHATEEDCIEVDYDDDEVTVGIENDEMGAYITYTNNTLPDFVIWKMLGESDYVIGLEPRTSALGGQEIEDNNAYVVLKPFEEYKAKIKFEFRRK